MGKRGLKEKPNPSAQKLISRLHMEINLTVTFKYTGKEEFRSSSKTV